MPATTTIPKNRIAANGHPEIAKESLYKPDKLKIRVVGVTPLLCANPSSMQLEGDSSGRTATKKKPGKEELARTAAYFNEQGHCAFPNSALVSCILTAAELMKLKIGTGRYPPSALSILMAGFTFDYETKMTTLVHPETGKPLTEADYAIDMQRGVNQNTGGGIVVVRPRFDQWAATFSLLVDSSNSELMGLINGYFDDILRFAGMSVGLGAFRAYVKPKGKTAKPRPGGPYGKFAAKIID